MDDSGSPGAGGQPLRITDPVLFPRVLEVARAGGIYAYQQMMIRDKDDNKVGAVVGDRSAFVGLRISLQL